MTMRDGHPRSALDPKQPAPRPAPRPALSRSLALGALFGACLADCSKTPEPFVTNQRIVYTDGLHNENTEMTVIGDRVLLMFRGGETGQVGSDKAHLNIYASTDQGATFTRQAEVSAASLPGMRDIRDPKFVQLNGHLFLYAISRLPGGHYRDLYGDAWTVRSESMDQGATWSDPVKTLSDVDDTGMETFWGMWRFTPRTFIDESGKTQTLLFAVGYDDGDTKVAMFSSPDGITWTKVSTVIDFYDVVPSEAELHFLGDNQQSAVAIVRLDDQGILQDGQSAFCVATAPFTTWSCNRRVEQRFDGPTWYSYNQRNFVFARKHLPCTFKRTAIYELLGDLTDTSAQVQVCELAQLNSAGDTAYTSVVPLDGGTVLTAWYSSTVPDAGAGDVPWLVGTYSPSDIWLANVDLDNVPEGCPAPPAKVECADGPVPATGVTPGSGSFLLSLAPVIYPAQLLQLQTTVTVHGTTSMDLVLQPLDAIAQTPVGSPWMAADVPLAADGAFTASFDLVFVPAEAFSVLSDPFLTLNSLTITGKATTADTFCGDVGGYAQVLGDSPSDRIDLTGSTFGAVRITGALPTPVARCE